MELTSIIGYIGFFFGVLVSVPQVIKSYRAKSTKGVSSLTYIFLLIAVCCYLVRAIAIKEWVFIFSNSFQIVITLTMLDLMQRYK